MKMKYAVLTWTYCTLLMVSTMGYVLDRKTEMKLRYTNLKLKYDNNEKTYFKDLIPSRGHSETSSFAEAEAEVLENGDYDNNENDFIRMEDGISVESFRGERNRRNTEECQEPNRNQLEAMLSQLADDSSDTDDKTIGEEYSDQGQCDEVRKAKIYISAAVNVRATCPWSYRLNVNGTRYPSTILYAKCNCNYCNEGSCKPVLKPQYVLYRKECGTDGVYQYRKTEVHVSVACVCSHFSNS